MDPLLDELDDLLNSSPPSHLARKTQRPITDVPPSSPPQAETPLSSSPGVPLRTLLATPGLYTLASLSSSQPGTPRAQLSPLLRPQSLPPTVGAHSPQPLGQESDAADVSTTENPRTPLSKASRIFHDAYGAVQLSDGFEWVSPRRTAKDSRRQGWGARRADLEETRAAAAEEAREKERETYEYVLEYLSTNNLTWGGLIEYVSDPNNQKGNARYYGFFAQSTRVQTVLGWWASSANSKTGRECMKTWAVEYVKNLVSAEGDVATRSKFLRTRTMSIDTSFALDFSMQNLRSKLLDYCPTAMELLHAFSTTTRQSKQMSQESRERKEVCVTTQALIGLASRSQQNSYAKYVFGLYAYACGAQRQVISVLSYLGLTCSYTSLIGNFRFRFNTSGGLTGLQDQDTSATTATPQHADEDGSESEDEDLWRNFEDIPFADLVTADPSSTSNQTSVVPEGVQCPIMEAPEEHSDRSSTQTHPTTASPPPVPSNPPRRFEAASGFLKRLSNACRQDTRDAYVRGLLAYVYDNINMLFKIAEQILGRKDSQQNGTCATAFTLFNANKDDMRTSDFIESFVKAPPLTVEDVLLTDEENGALTERLTHTVLRILLQFGGSQFARFKDDITACLPVTADKIPLHHTEIYPLPAMHIDESSTTGNADVLTAIFDELGLDMSSSEFTDTLKIVAGDQLSVARIRSLVTARAGHDTFAHSFLWAVCMPGLFHYKMTATHSLMELHYGTNNTRNPGSIAFSNTVLDRKPIVISSLPPFRVVRDTIFVKLYAHTLHCLGLVAEAQDIDEYAASVDFAQLKQHARQLVDQYANAEVASKIRRQREAEVRKRRAALDDIDLDTLDENISTAPFQSGDVVFENAVLFLRDALVLREYTDAVKVGDSGRVLTVLKHWALGFRGSGNPKYAHEMLHLLHNITHVWPAPLRRIILQNWLVNPTGKPDGWVEVDLMQEHLNFWVKTIYKAHGSNASWEWLAMVSPCINILRRLATHINTSLGARQGTKHTSPDLQKDIHELMRSLTEHRVYSIEPGRVVDGLKQVVPNAVALGCTLLAGPLADFNAQLKRLQRRCTMRPLVGTPYASTHLGTTHITPPGPHAASSSSTGTFIPEPDLSDVPTPTPGLDDIEQGLSIDDADFDLGDPGTWLNEQWNWDGDRLQFSLDSAEDVALDMDVVEEEYLD